MKIICMNYGKLIILIIQPKILKVERQYAVKTLNGTYECCQIVAINSMFVAFFYRKRVPENNL